MQLVHDPESIKNLTILFLIKTVKYGLLEHFALLAICAIRKVFEL
jgi:hypothetical protein